MKRQDFDALVRRIEARYADRAEALSRVAMIWVVLGLLGILAWIGLILGLGIAAFLAGVVLPQGIGLLAIGLGVLLILYGISQAAVFLRADSPPPDGRLLPREEAPALNALLEDLCQHLRCRPFDEVRVSMAFNANVREVPRLGVLGWPRTILELGMPLLESLSPDELRAVLAHEFAHLSARHGRNLGRIYRLHRTWGTLFEGFQKLPSGQADRLVRWSSARFAAWYWPRFHARAFVLSRAQEYQADRDAAAVTSPEALVSALWRMECLTPWLAERFWPDLLRRVTEEPEPPADVLPCLTSALRTAATLDDATRWTARGWSRLTGQENTHPAFRDRALALIPAEAERPSRPFPHASQPSAAEVFLGENRERIEAELSARWQRDLRADWRERHRRASAEARRGSAEATDAATDRERRAAERDALALWDEARAAIEVGGIASAEPILRAVLERSPQHAGAAVLLGQHRLSLGNLEGERLLKNVIDQDDERWLPAACTALQEHYLATGQSDRLKEVRARLDRHEEEIAASRRERSTITPRDPLAPHGLDAEQLGPLREFLDAEPDCAAAWLVRKDLRYFPQRPLFLLCVLSRVPGLALHPRGKRPGACSKGGASDRAAGPGPGHHASRPISNPGETGDGLSGFPGFPRPEHVIEHVMGSQKHHVRERKMMRPILSARWFRRTGFNAMSFWNKSPRSMNRHVLSGLLVLTLLALPARGQGPIQDGLHLGSGTKAGEITDRSAIILVRLTSTPGQDDQGLIPGREGLARVRYGIGEDLKDAATTAWEVAKADEDYSIQFSIDNLQPASRYFYVVQYKANETAEVKRADPGSFVTAPRRRTAGRSRFNSPRARITAAPRPTGTWPLCVPISASRRATPSITTGRGWREPFPRRTRPIRRCSACRP